MVERKFTPPTEFPAEYVNGKGSKITLLARGEGLYPLLGQNEEHGVCTFTEEGCFLNGGTSARDLHDIPKKQVHWANDYEHGRNIGYWRNSREEADKTVVTNDPRICVIRREWTEGELPQYFVEEV